MLFNFFKCVSPFKCYPFVSNENQPNEKWFSFSTTSNKKNNKKKCKKISKNQTKYFTM